MSEKEKKENKGDLNWTGISLDESKGGYNPIKDETKPQAPAKPPKKDK